MTATPDTESVLRERLWAGRPVAGVLGIGSVIIAAAAVAHAIAGPRISGFDWLILVWFALFIVVGELNRIELPGARESAPMSLAVAFALAMTFRVWENHPVTFEADVVIAATAVAMLLGAAPAVLRGRRVRVDEVSARFLAVVVAALLFRQAQLWHGQTLLQLQDDWGQQRWLSAVSMVAVSGVALVTQGMCVAMSTSAREHRPLLPTVVDELRQALGLSTALAASGALIALAERPMGFCALPVFLVPLVLTQFAIRRFASIRRTYGQTIRTLSRMTQVGGYTLPGHPDRVASMSVAIAGDLGLSQRETLELEYAALLHDIGQVALRERIPGGATVMSAPADQDRIARDGAEIVRRTGVLDSVAAILDQQAKPYRQMRELGEVLPMASRIIKVSNAYDDYAGDPCAETDDGRTAAAIERMHLGLGYEYDPRVVESLLRVLARRAAAARPSD